MSNALAIDGGAPVRRDRLPYARHTVEEADIAAVAEVLRGDWLTTGPGVEGYERAFAERVGAAHAVAVNSGTAALHAAAHAAGLTTGDEAIVPALSFVATANCVLYMGARPVFADIEPDTGLIDVRLLESLVTPHTRAVLPVDYAGQPADLDAINALAHAHQFAVIEDAAHALGATFHGERVGNIATFTAFSTHPVKHIATGEGGMLATNDPALAQTARAFRNHGITSDARTRETRGGWEYDMEALGYNYRMPDILCALGRSQLSRLDTSLARRRAIAIAYTQAFADIPCIEPLIQREKRQSAWHLYVVRLRLDALRVDRAQIFRALRAEGIGVNVHYRPIYLHPYYQRLGYAPGLCPRAEALYARLLTLPLWPGMTDADVADVIEAIRKVCAAYAR